MQLEMFSVQEISLARPLKYQLLKWVGNKQRFAHEIIGHFPPSFGRYFEPFLGTGAVLATLGLPSSFGSDLSKPLIEIWQALSSSPDVLKTWYRERWQKVAEGDKVKRYEAVKESYNSNPNGADLLFLCRCCYGGVVRFRREDGYMSTPCGVHDPISPASFDARVDEWHERVRDSTFACMDYREAMRLTEPGDLVYCDPPYLHSQAILYRAQDFSLADLFDAISECKSRGVFVVLSIDGTKKSGKDSCILPIPQGLFVREIFVNCGRSMLKRFQMNGRSLERECVADRLLLTY